MHRMGVYAEWYRAADQVADLAKVSPNKRGEFLEALTTWCDGWDEGDEIEHRERWNALSDKDKRAIEIVRSKVIAAYNAARALTPAAEKHVDQSSPHDLVATFNILVAALTSATRKRLPVRRRRGRGRPRGRTRETLFAGYLLGLVESCGGKLPSVDHDPDSSTINKIIEILQPHFPSGALRRISAATFRRIKALTGTVGNS
jgi:hypothetical protein